MFAFNGAPTRIRAPNMAGSQAPRSTLGIKAGGNANTLPINSPWVCVSTPKPEPCESFCRAMGEISRLRLGRVQAYITGAGAPSGARELIFGPGTAIRFSAKEH